jgi:signal transduction histidine kinase
LRNQSATTTKAAAKGRYNQYFTKVGRISNFWQIAPVAMPGSPMNKLIKNFFTLPDFKSDTQLYTARMLRVVVGVTAILSIFYTIINITSDPGNSLRYLGQFVFITASLLAMALLVKKGKPQGAALLLVFSSWLVFTAAAYTSGGVISAAYMGYLVVLTMAGIVAARQKWTFLAAALCALSGYGLLYAERHEFLPQPAVALDSTGLWLDSLIYFSIVAALQILASRNIQDALQRSRQEAQEKQEAERREKRRSVLLRRVIELGQDITQAAELDWCLKTIHQSVQKGLGFDRVGVFLYDEEHRVLHGTYGTDRQGNLADISRTIEHADEYKAWQIALNSPDGVSLIEDYDKKYQFTPEDEMYGVKQHLTVSAWAGKKPVALIATDNMITNRPIEPEIIEALSLFAGYAGLAIVNARHLESVNQELESFSYTVSHDLRSPLRAVVGFSQILMTDYKEQSIESGDSLHHIKRINENGKKMGKLIDDLLNFSRIGRQTMRISDCETKIIVEGTIERLRERNNPREINWIIQDLPPCQADYIMFQQVWFNLLDNASRYSLSSSEPTVEVGSLQQNGQIVFFVRDNGQGFEMKYAEKIFAIFQRLNHGEELDSTGIGLSIVQRILQRHGGKIWAVSEPNKGATFYFSLPS